MDEGLEAKLRRRLELHRAERQAAQMTLGKLIQRLGDMPGHQQLCGCLYQPHSYRGYYDDVAFEYDSLAVQQASGLLSICLETLNRVFTGYKGGEYTYDIGTPVWVARWGHEGVALVDVRLDGTIIMEAREY